MFCVSIPSLSSRFLDLFGKIGKKGFRDNSSLIIRLCKTVLKQISFSAIHSFADWFKFSVKTENSGDLRKCTLPESKCPKITKISKAFRLETLILEEAVAEKISSVFDAAFFGECIFDAEFFRECVFDAAFFWWMRLQIAADVSLPQFKVLGHRQKTIEASLSTGEEPFTLATYFRPPPEVLFLLCMEILYIEANIQPDHILYTSNYIFSMHPYIELPLFNVFIHWIAHLVNLFLTTYLYLRRIFFPGNYSRLACEIQFTRSIGYYLIQIYIPSR